MEEQLRQAGDLCSNALLLLRATGLRIRECPRQHANCLRHLGSDD
jgi:hypothetical protein